MVVGEAMIDAHCHLEQPDYDADRDEVIEKCKRGLDAIVTSCAHPGHLELTMRLISKYDGFVFATIGIHPSYVKEITDHEKDAFIESIRANRNKIVGIGEVGLDYDWVKEPELRQKQVGWFIDFIKLSKELDLPIIVHSRGAYQEAIEVLERQDAGEVLMHMFGAYQLLKRVIQNNWFTSLNTIIMTSKKYRKVARDVPLENLLTETDSPWLGVDQKRNDPTSVKIVVEKLAEIRKTRFEEVDEKTTLNAIKFFRLRI